MVDDVEIVTFWLSGRRALFDFDRISGIGGPA
jgi:hypothetical protein